VKVDRYTVHDSVTLDRIIEAVKRHNTTLDNPGICVHCGEDADDCEPDARQCKCESCGEHAVYGAEELLLRLA
jgi:hypothetical protein